LKQWSDLPRENPPNDWRAEAWNQDYAWFRKEEGRMFLPMTLSTGTKHIIPEDLIHRIARCHLVDNVRGQTSVFPDKCIEKARLTAEVLEGNLRKSLPEFELRVLGA